MKSPVLILAVLVGCTDDVEPLPSTFNISTAKVTLGPIACGSTMPTQIRVNNVGPEDLVLAIETDTRGVQVPAELEVPALESRFFTISATISRRVETGTVRLIGFGLTREIQLELLGSGITVTFDPPVLDFGNVLPNTTKEMPLTARLGAEADANFALDLALGATSTPRFEIVGGTMARLHSAAPSATFMVRYHSSATPFTHDGTIPITVSGGSCTPSEVDLIAVTVP